MPKPLDITTRYVTDHEGHTVTILIDALLHPAEPGSRTEPPQQAYIEVYGYTLAPDSAPVDDLPGLVLRNMDHIVDHLESLTT